MINWNETNGYPIVSDATIDQETYWFDLYIFNRSTGGYRLSIDIYAKGDARRAWDMIKKQSFEVQPTLEGAKSLAEPYVERCASLIGKLAMK